MIVIGYERCGKSTDFRHFPTTFGEQVFQFSIFMLIGKFPFLLKNFIFIFHVFCFKTFKSTFSTFVNVNQHFKNSNSITATNCCKCFPKAFKTLVLENENTLSEKFKYYHHIFPFADVIQALICSWHYYLSSRIRRNISQDEMKRKMSKNKVIFQCIIFPTEFMNTLL